MTIYFDTEKQAYSNKQTLLNWGKVYLTECTYEQFEDFQKGKLIFDENDNLVENPKYDEEKAEEERARLDNLSMTRGDVFEALILAKGLGKAQIRAMIEKAELDTVTKALYLNRFDEALEFYRGYPIFDMLGQALGITGEMLDKFFETKDYTYLIPSEQVSEKSDQVSDQVTDQVEEQDDNTTDTAE